MPTEITPYVRLTPVLSGLFDSGRDYVTYRPRGTDDFLLILTESGGGRFDTTGGPLHSRAGDLHLLPPGVPHDYRTDAGAGRWRLRWVHFTPDPDWADLLDWPVVGGDVRGLTAGDAAAWAGMIDAWERVHHAALSADRLRDRRALNAVEALLLACEADRPQYAGAAADPLVRRAIEHVTRRLSEPHSVQSLAEHVGLSPSRFAHRFKQATQTTPARYVEEVRLRRAGQLLAATSLSVKEIAAQLGFASQFYFSARFKRHSGKNPSAYRQGLVQRR